MNDEVLIELEGTSLTLGEVMSRIVRTYNPYPAVGIPGSMISASFENFEYSAGALF